jgi:hypothetical protein
MIFKCQLKTSQVDSAVSSREEFDHRIVTIAAITYDGINVVLELHGKTFLKQKKSTKWKIGLTFPKGRSEPGRISLVQLLSYTKKKQQYPYCLTI